MEITVLLVDDHPMFRKGLRMMLDAEEDIRVVGEAGDGEEAVQRARELSPDVIVTDITMPNVDGIEATRRIVSEFPQVKVIPLSIHSGKRFVENMLRAGAAGYILKESVPEELVDAVRAVQRGDVPLSAAISGVVVSEYVRLLSQSDGGDDRDALTEESTIPLLRTKLHRPILPQDVLPRERLLDQLEQGRNLPMTLVSAPAGYGKSTLVAGWLAKKRERRAAWLSLGEGDGDIGTFLSYLVAAVKVPFPEACPETTALLQAAQMPPCSVLTDALNGDLEAIEQPFILVLDDYHLVSDAATHELLDNLLRYPPRPLHLVLIMRHDPPISLASLRARGWLTEIRQDDLRFSQLEVRAVLEQMAGISVSDSALAHLEEEIEGWIVGLHLVGLLMRNQGDPEAFLFGLKGGFRQVQDYLLEEVLATQPAVVQDGMIKVSLLDRFCAPVVEALCFAPDDPAATRMTGEDFIRAINAANLFVIPLDVGAEWFRYHHLFRDLLRSQLERHHTPSEIAVLHMRISEWLESQGLITESIEHALAADETVRAAEIIETHRHHEFLADRWYVVERWLALLAPDVKRERPELLLSEAWIANCKHQMMRIPAIIEQIESVIGSGQFEPSVSAELALFQGILAYWDGQADCSRQHLEEAVSLLSGHATPFESEAELYLGLARCMAGDRDRAIQALEDRIDRSDTSEDQLRSRLIASLVFIYLVCGDLPQARAEVERLQRVAKRLGARNTEAWSHYLLASANLHAGESATALMHFANAVDQRYVFESMPAVDSFAGLALTLQLLGRDNEASETADRLREFAVELNERQYLNSADSCRARLSLLRGDSRSAATWADSFNERPVPSSSFMWLEVPSITQARVLIAVGSERSLEKATGLLAEIQQVSVACRFTCQTIEVAVLRSMTLKMQGRTDEALAAVKKAVVMAEPGGWVRPFVELGQPMADLLKRLRTENVAVECVDRLLAAFPAGQPEAATEPSGVESMLSSVSESDRPIAGGLTRAGSHAADAAVGNVSFVEPLTNRELDVLQLLAERLYDKEIAKALSISIHTVRSHLKHIFEKLHVAGRRQAVIKAEELGLLKGN